jgi:tetratricopeptide (TPR) repeat protein
MTIIFAFLMNRLFLITAFLLSSALSWAQDAGTLKKSGEFLMAEQNYAQALNTLLRAHELKPGDHEVMANIGICYYSVNRLADAETWLLHSVKKKKAPPDAFLFLGKLNHAELQFEEAVQYYKAFLKNTPAHHPLRDAVKDDILHCASGIKIRRLVSEVAVLNLGDAINSTGDDFKPLLHPNDGSTLYFSSIRAGNAGSFDRRQEQTNLYSDIFTSELQEGDWTAPKPLSVFVNSVEHEVALGFDWTGELLYFFRGKDLASGSMLVDTLRTNPVERTLFFNRLQTALNPQQGDVAPFFFNDSILLFSSRRLGGFGGHDLYIATRAGGVWSEPENLGEPINTPYDETSPCLANDGRTLFFSSNHPDRSIGGLDILRSTYIDRQMKWTVPQNPGIPLNSAGDDEGFFLLPDGTKAFFSSSRKEGLGGKDLYVALFEHTLAAQLRRSEPPVFYFVQAFLDASAGNSLPPSLSDDFLENAGQVTLRPIFYSPRQVEFLPESIADLTLLALLMKKFPQMQVALVAHHDHSDEVPAGTPLCELIMDKALDFLREQGVFTKNLVLEGVGSSYPLVKGDNAGSQPLNRRIETYITNGETPGLEVRITEPLLGTSQAAAEGKFFRNAMRGLFYRVEIPIGDYAALDELRRRFPAGSVQYLPATGRRYFNSGMYLTWQSAEAWRAEVTKQGFTQASVVPYLKGWRLSKDTSVQFLDEYPDLMNFAKE